MTPANPYASPTVAEYQFSSTCIVWEGRQIEVRGQAVARRLWNVIRYTITIDGVEVTSDTQIRGTDKFVWQFSHQGRAVDASFEPSVLPVQRHQPFRLYIDGQKVARETVSIRDFGFYLCFYSCLLLMILFGVPAILLIVLGVVGT